ncbi:4669_t:CDS:2, partial [Racocetra persica]
EQLYAILEFNDERGNVQKRLGSEWDEIMIEERDIRRTNEEIILYNEGPVADLILAQEEDNRSISDLFDYYYEKGSCSNIKYNIGEVEDDQRKQLLELLRENPDLCAQDISNTIEFLDRQGDQVPINLAPEINDDLLETRMPLFIEDLHRIGDPAKELCKVEGTSWNQQMDYLCIQIQLCQLDRAILLQHYYQLGERLAMHNWDKEVKREMKD